MYFLYLFLVFSYQARELSMEEKEETLNSTANFEKFESKARTRARAHPLKI